MGPSKEPTCQACGSLLGPNHRFCPSCGASRFGVGNADPPGAQDPARNARYPQAQASAQGRVPWRAIAVAIAVAGLTGLVIFGPRALQAVQTAATPSCTVGLAGAAVSITVAGGSADADCRSIQGTTTDGGSWYVYAGGEEPAGAIICQVTLDGDLYTVRDQGSLNLYGSSICSNLIGQSHPQPAPVSSDPALPIPSEPIGTACGLRVLGHDATVIGHDPGCSAFAAAYPPAGAGWTTYDALGGAPAQDGLICSGVIAAGSFSIWDSGGAYYATDLCQRLGWQ